LGLSVWEREEPPLPLQMKDLMEAGGLRLLSEPTPGDLDALILSPHLHRLDSLRGARHQVPSRNLVFALSPGEVQEICNSPELRERLLRHSPSAIVAFGGPSDAGHLKERSGGRGLVLLGTGQPQVTVERALGQTLFARVDTQVSLHGVMVLLWGLGVLILGPSGSGKTDATLEFLRRGHALVADDAVALFCPEPGTIWGRPLAAGPHHMAVYGLGLIEVASLYGARAVAAEGPIGLAVGLLEPGTMEYANPLETRGEFVHLMGVAIPYLPLSQVRSPNLVNLVELAVRVQKEREMAAGGGRPSAEKVR
jgi:serine kinase of HPr protein (carbohydrate metabolism regulator)